ncbi:MAG: hypothetical protein IPG45_07355 [Deltaproteobacteria bacterium]|nr:hypothetical protein [Deltaproteobacteria bacterium]
MPPLPESPASRTQKTHPSLLGTFFGALKPVVAGVIVAGVMSTTAIAQNGGAPLPGAPRVDTEVVRTVAEQPRFFEPPEGNAQLDLDHHNRELEALLLANRITVTEMSNARDILRRVFINQEPGLTLPRDYRGRVDLVALATLGTRADDMTAGERAFANMTRELELRMRVTARDMADPNTRFIEGAPGYKEISADEMRRLVERTVRNVPLGELPGGAAVAHLFEALPQMQGVDATRLSANELSRVAGDRYKDWADARLRPLLAGHEVEAGILAFAAVTGLRASSPDVARLMDRMGVKVRVFSVNSEDASLYSRGRLVYRDGHILPDLDVEAGARRTIGNTTLRGALTSTLSAEADAHVTGAATLGARYDEGRYWLDTAVTYFYPEDRIHASMRGGYIGDTLVVSGLVASTLGDGVAIGDARGRINAEIDVTRDLNLGGGVRGNWGVFVGAGADTNGDNSDVRAGFVFRLEW